MQLNLFKNNFFFFFVLNKKKLINKHLDDTRRLLALKAYFQQAPLDTFKLQIFLNCLSFN